MLHFGTRTGSKGEVLNYGVVSVGGDALLMTDDGVLKPTGVVGISSVPVLDGIVDVIGICGFVQGGMKIVLDSCTLTGSEKVVYRLVWFLPYAIHCFGLMMAFCKIGRASCRERV